MTSQINILRYGNIDDLGAMLDEEPITDESQTRAALLNLLGLVCRMQDSIDRQAGRIARLEAQVKAHEASADWCYEHGYAEHRRDSPECARAQESAL